jgi:ArsR family transcriptional regulator, arsenate/arsenite/antimonite-responsive transcriptional repressor
MKVDYEAARDFFAIMTTGDRLKIIIALDDRELTVSELAEATDMPHMKMTKLLIPMRLSGILERRREGLNVYYRIHSPVARKMLDLVKEQFSHEP